MSPRDLVVFLEPEHDSGQRLAFAAALAKRWSAHLIAIFVTRPLMFEPHADYAVGPTLTSLLVEHRRKTEAAIAIARARFDALAERRSFTAEWRVSENELPEAMMLHARHASLAILGPPARQRCATTMLGLAERMILASGRPTLLLPDEWPADRIGRRIVIGWNGGREATRAIADAMPFLVAADAVHLVVVPDTRTGRLLGEEPGADMATHLARQNVPVVVEQGNGNDAGDALLRKCGEADADLLVMGAMGRPLIGEIIFGGATRTVLASATLPVLLSS